jgi:pyrophosphatase PpaX
MNFDYYLFDLDGTLLNLGDMSNYADQILVEVLKRLKLSKLPTNLERKSFWFNIENYINVLVSWGAKNPHDFWKFYDEIDFEKRKLRISNREIHLFDDVIGTLEKIYDPVGNKKLAIVTNTVDNIVHFILDTFKIHQYFHEIFSLGFENDQDSAKPSPDGILTILKKFNYNPSRNKAIMIGDSVFDILAAKKAKISACLVKRHFERNYKEWKVQPDYVIENLDEVVNL